MFIQIKKIHNDIAQQAFSRSGGDKFNCNTIKVMKNNKYIFDSMSVFHVTKSNLLLNPCSSTLHHFCQYYITGQTINNT